MSAPLRVEGLTHRFEAVTALDGVTLSLDEGELLTLLGPSGCGKTTALRAVAGLERPDAGRVLLGGTLVSDGAGRFVAPHRRDVGMVPQSFGIWPHMTVHETVAFPLRAAPRSRRPGRVELRERVEEALATVRLEGLADRSATRLSGGQQQRLALARALVRRPRLLLLDEPLSSLDAGLRSAMRAELAALQRRLGIATLHVTHDQAEALGMSDRVAVMDAGRIVQQGTPRAIYERPATRFVAGFVGTTNLLPGALLNGRAAEHGRGLLSIRPEAVRVHTGAAPARPNVVAGTIAQLQFVGERIDCRVDVGPHTLLAHLLPTARVEPGEAVWLELPPDALTALPDGAS